MWGNLDPSFGGNASSTFPDESHVEVEATGSESEAKKQMNVVPVFIKHLLTCRGESLTLGKDLVAKLVTFIARVLSIEQTETKNTYNLQDDTGKILGIQWLEPKNNQEGRPLVQIDTYVRIVGHLRENSGQKHVLVEHIRPMSNLNELTNHFLEVLHMFASLSKAAPSKEQKVDNAASRMNTNEGSTIGLTKEQALVLKIIRTENKSENGIQKALLKFHVPKNILPELDKIIDFLISEGHIYSTISEEYYKTI